MADAIACAAFLVYDLPTKAMNYDTHLKSSDLERLLHGRADRKTVMAAHHHLLQCRRCRINLFVYDEALAGLYLDDFYGAGTAAAWRRQIEQPIDTLSYVTSRGLDISGLNVQATRLHAVNTESFQDLGTLVIVLERGHAMRKTNPPEAKFLLEGAIQALQAQSGWPKRERSELLARAYAYLGNTHRILYEFEAAHAVFKKANAYLQAAKPALETAGEVAWMEGFLYVDQRNYVLGIAKLRAAHRKLDAVNNTKALEVEISLAITYSQAGQKLACVKTIEALLERHPQSGFPPGTFLAILQNLILGYAQTNQSEQAKALLPKVRRLAEEEGNLLDLVRVDWAEAEVHKAAGHRTLAAAGFRDVAAKFMAAQIPVDAALATLSQAEMYLELGDTKAAAGLAEALVPIFQSKGIHREATVAGLMVVEDLRREAATLAQVQGLVERLQGRATQSS